MAHTQIRHCSWQFANLFSCLNPFNKAFISLLQLPPDVLVDCMRLMQHELSPNVELNHRWTAQLCLTVPPSYIHFLPVGNSSIITINRPPQGPQMPQPQFITIFVIQLKSLGGRNMQEVTIPLKYDHNTHSTGKTSLFSQLNQLLLLFNRSIHGPFLATANARASDQFAAAAANQRNPERVQSANGPAKSNGPVHPVYGDPRDHEPVSNCLDSTILSL